MKSRNFNFFIMHLDVDPFYCQSALLSSIISARLNRRPQSSYIILILMTSWCSYISLILKQIRCLQRPHMYHYFKCFDANLPHLKQIPAAYAVWHYVQHSRKQYHTSQHTENCISMLYYFQVFCSSFIASSRSLAC